MNDLKKTVRFIAIASIPCFEYWLLLHFQNFMVSDRYLVSEKLNGHFLKLAGHLAPYEKNDKTVFKKTKHLLKDAMKQAERINTGSEYGAKSKKTTYTGVPMLIKALIPPKDLKAILGQP